MDVSRTNANTLYVGCEDRIYKSLDGGFTWTAMPSYLVGGTPTWDGATDICIDPLLGGVIYYWCTDGKVKCAIASDTPIDLLTATRQDNPLTIGRDINSGKLWAITPTNLQMRDMGSWATQVASVMGGRGLRAYLGGKVVYLDATKINYSANYGSSYADKTGDWSGFSDPKTIHLLPT